jgi:hypothetical protein
VTFELSRPLRSNPTGRDVGGLEKSTGPAESDHRLLPKYRKPNEVAATTNSSPLF